MSRWEYWIDTINPATNADIKFLHGAMNDLGASGWEIFFIERKILDNGESAPSVTFYCKRPKKEERDEGN